MKIFMYAVLFAVFGFCSYEVSMEEVRIMMELQNEKT